MNTANGRRAVVMVTSSYPRFPGDPIATFMEPIAAGIAAKGYEVQVNNSHTDWRRTGGLYAIQDVKEAPAKDNEWFTEHIVVRGKQVTVSVNGKPLVDYTEPASAERPPDMKGRLISSGTFALQGHDPKSKVLYRNIQVKVLP